MARMMFALAAGLFFCAAAQALEGTAVCGVWTVQDGRARVEIYKAQDGTFEGKIVWTSEPNYPDGDPEAGKPKRDRENPDASKRDRPILGMVFMEKFTFDGKEQWKGGRVYDAESGNVYKCKMSMEGEDTLDVRGFIGISLIGRTEKWTRYKEGK